MLASSSSFLAVAFALLASTVSAGKTADGVFDGDRGATLIDYQPAITSPSGGEVWIAGNEYTASWNQELPSGIALQNVSQTADLVLGYTVEGETSLHLSWTLAQDIQLYAPNPASVTFTLPSDLETRDSYLLVLLGSTHNQSGKFTILNNPLAGLFGGSASSSSSSAAPATTTPAGSSSEFAKIRRGTFKNRIVN
ncbi:hypothetical protein JCM10207_004517 [Rhodosporidiobolus poonsookiae]